MKRKRIFHLLSAVLLVISTTISTPVLAAESATFVSVTQEASAFSVELPTVLPVLFTETETYTASKAVLNNNSYGPIRLTEIRLTDSSEFFYNVSKHNLRAFSVLDTNIVKTPLSYTEPVAINGKDDLPISYRAVGDMAATSELSFWYYEPKIVMAINWS